MVTTSTEASHRQRTATRVSEWLDGRESVVCGSPDGAAMQTTAHIRASGLRRVAAVMALAVTVAGLVVPSASVRAHAVHTAFQHGPAGGCGTSGC
jgi:hypothetical protein